MKLNLNTGIANRFSATVRINPQPSGLSTSGVANPGLKRNPDTIATGASRALAAFVSSRALRTTQLAAAVRNGAYWVSSAAISSSIVASATA